MRAFAPSTVIAMLLGACRGEEAPSADAGPMETIDACASGTVDAGEDAPLAYDLDGDGVAAARLFVRPCPEAADRTCLLVRLGEIGDRDIPIHEGPVRELALGTIGPHFGGSEAVFVHGADEASGVPFVWIVDLDAATVRASVSAPTGWTFPVSAAGGPGARSVAYFALVRGPDGLRHPFLGPGASYVPSRNESPTWTFGCQLDPSRIETPDTGCGLGFRRVEVLFANEDVAGSLANPNDTFRHSGGWLADADGDGWDDLHLPYLWLIHTVSGRTGTPLSTTAYDVAAEITTEMNRGFHSGRNYGGFASFTMSTGEIGVLLASANPVGTFSDYNCNVSRFVALLAATAGTPSSRHLAWSRYVSFDKSLFAAPYTQSPPVVLRAGDMLDGCLHRFSTGLFRAGERMVTVYNRFASDLPEDDCMAEQYAEVMHGFAPPYPEMWGACAERSFLPTLGHWSVEVVDAETGEALEAWPDAYAWGKSERLMPGGETVFVIEELAGKVRFDRVGEPHGTLEAASLTSAGEWRRLGRFPLLGRPVVRGSVPIEGPIGVSNGGVTELDAPDVDGDGLDDVWLDGVFERVGWSTCEEAFVGKRP